MQEEVECFKCGAKRSNVETILHCGQCGRKTCLRCECCFKEWEVIQEQTPDEVQKSQEELRPSTSSSSTEAIGVEVVLVSAAQKGWCMKSADAKTAYVHAESEDEKGWCSVCKTKRERYETILCLKCRTCEQRREVLKALEEFEVPRLKALGEFEVPKRRREELSDLNEIIQKVTGTT